MINPCLTFSIIRYRSRSNPRKVVERSLHLSVVAIEKGAFVSPSTIVTNFTYFTWIYNLEKVQKRGIYLWTNYDFFSRWMNQQSSLWPPSPRREYVKNLFSHRREIPLSCISHDDSGWLVVFISVWIKIRQLVINLCRVILTEIN